jgi:hypothetical protein
MHEDLPPGASNYKHDCHPNERAEMPKLHYLGRWAEFEQNAIYLGDECDLLGFYLDTGFNIGSQEFSKEPFNIMRLSKVLDPYFMREVTGIDSPKPTRCLAQWRCDLLARLEDRSIPRWTEASYALLNFIYENQQVFEADFRRCGDAVWHEFGSWRTYGTAKRPSAET